jgi:glucokinase
LTTAWRRDYVQGMSRVAIGIDLGGTKLRAARVAGGRVEARVVQELGGPEEPAVVARRVAEVARGLGKGPVGIGVAAMLRGNSGVVANAPNLGWREVPFRSLVEHSLKRRVVLENDLSAITWGEFRFGAGRGARSVACVFVGTGVGGGAVLDGRLYRGSSNTALEIGHVKIAPPDRRCGCGARGCLETYVGGTHLGRRPTRAAVRVAGTLLGRALADLCTLFNPERLILGGSVWHGEAALRRRTRAVLARAINPPALAGLRLVDDRLGDDAGVLGAADLARMDARRRSG